MLIYQDKLSFYESEEIKQFKEIFYIGCERSNSTGFEDENGYYQVLIRDHLAYRYEVVSILGKGSFGTVVKCQDHKTKEVVAIKILRKVP